MKILLLVVLFTSSVFAQTQAEEWRQTKTGWREVARTTGEPVTFWFYEKFHQRGQDVEVWLKTYDPELSLKMKAKMKRFSHQMQFYVFHCSDRRFSLGRSIFYDTKGNVLGGTPPEAENEPVPPESVFDVLYQHFCVPKNTPKKLMKKALASH